MSEELMNMEKKMTTSSHNRGFEDHVRRKVKKEDAKVMLRG